jgi:TonB family protein
MRTRVLITVPMLGLLVLSGCATTAKPVLRPVKNAPPSNPPGVFDVSKVGVRPIPTFQAPLRYPSELQRAGIAGEGIVAFVIGTDGTVGEAVVVSATDARFGDAAVEAIQQWRFRPAQINGTFVRCHMMMPIRFTNPNTHAGDHAGDSAGGRLKLDRAQMDRLDLARQSADFKRESERANAEMVAEPTATRP